MAERVHLLGRVGDQEKLAWYCCLRSLRLTSRLEGFGLAAGEAMACGLPVVAFAAGSLPELVIDGETGLLIPLDDVHALSAALVRVLSDPDRRPGWQKQAARINRDFRWPVAAAHTLSLYEGLLS